VPIPDQTIAHFRFAGTLPVGQPGKVSVRRKGSTLIVTWAPATGAVRYGIVIDRTGGTQLELQVPGRRHVARIVKFPASEGGTVSVSALGALGTWGKARTGAAFTARVAPATIFRTQRGR
jgi:hypothetical protein